ncbi:ATP-dependent DNA helicase [Aspergillus arachidicola]|uniref:DNA 3'-5' helicase n=1 Tax=Aspergillus arachidicola TaxID=656916 RepID=A0A2G7EKZ8_9EURO|nr:ATP-dependent DNA helicase [Aspergillus arachidicola]
MDSILDGLNSAQRAAVSSPSPILQVLAPPGSGKTKTLTARVAYLLAHHGYRPQDVICCTFTIKASREMRERLAKLVGDRVQSRLILGTFHSICRRYLVTYGYLIGLRKGFGIADSGDSLAIIRRIVKRLQLNIQPNMARGRISYQKAHGVTPEDLEAKQMKGSKVLEHREFVQVYQAYESHLADSNLLDYDDLLLRCAQLLRQHPECVSNVQSVLVDEFQDTNHIQYQLMNLFASQNRRITVVGDPDQSIYGFRSAEIKNLTRMQQLYSDTSVVLLEDNYRSSGSILSSAQDVIEQDSSRPAKRLQPTHSVGTMPVLRKLPTAEAEAQWIVLEIKRCIAMTGKLLKYSDFAILLRSAALSRHIESEMGKQGMPYRMVGGLRFFDRVEIKLLLDYLRVISQPGNTDALLRIINVPSRKIGEESIRSLMSGAEKANKPLWDFMKDVAQGRRSTEKTLSKPTSNGLGNFVGLIESSRQKLLECTDCSAPKKLLEFVIKKLSFREYLTSTYGTNEENKWANVEELMGQAEDTAAAGAENEHDDSLPEIQGLSQQQAHPGEEALSRFLANVALSTEILQQEGEDEDSDEERRLLYVAMTRAQALLYLSYPLEQSRSGETTSIVYAIADILRRPRPTLKAMLEGQVSLPSTLDDQWTVDGREAADAVFRWDGSRAVDGEEPSAKRPRYSRESSTSTTTTYVSASAYTMNGSNLSVPTTMSLGFSTAREYIATSTAARQEQRPGLGFENKSKTAGTGSSGRSAVGLSQQSISGFFSKPSSQPKPKSSESAPAHCHKTPGDRNNVIGQTVDGKNKNVLPTNFSTNRPQAQRLQAARPILEPSDPNRYTWLATSSKPTEKPILRSGEEGKEISDKGEAGREWAASEIKRPQGPVGGARPATTYHTTTMSMLQSAAPVPMRRTLGIRRSMNGWEERMKRAGNQRP